MRRYRALLTTRPLTPIEEDSEEEEELNTDPDSPGDTWSAQTSPYLRPQLRPDETITPNDGPPSRRRDVATRGGSESLMKTLSRILGTATIVVEGFEGKKAILNKKEHIASNLDPEACSVLWHVCQVYGKTRMAIDLVEQELMTIKDKLETAQQTYSDLTKAEVGLKRGIAVARDVRLTQDQCLREWRQKYRRAVNVNFHEKVDNNKLLLELTARQRSCAEVTCLNQAVRSFMAINRDNPRSSRGIVPGHPSLCDIPINGRFNSSPRILCPKVTLTLPMKRQTTTEISFSRMPWEGQKKISTSEQRNIRLALFHSSPRTDPVIPEGKDALRRSVDHETKHHTSAASTPSVSALVPKDMLDTAKNDGQTSNLEEMVPQQEGSLNELIDGEPENKPCTEYPEQKPDEIHTFEPREREQTMLRVQHTQLKPDQKPNEVTLGHRRSTGTVGFPICTRKQTTPWKDKSSWTEVLDNRLTSIFGTRRNESRSNRVRWGPQSLHGPSSPVTAYRSSKINLSLKLSQALAHDSSKGDQHGKNRKKTCVGLLKQEPEVGPVLPATSETDNFRHGATSGNISPFSFQPSAQKCKSDVFRLARAKSMVSFAETSEIMRAHIAGFRHKALPVSKTDSKFEPILLIKSCSSGHLTTPSPENARMTGTK